MEFGSWAIIQEPSLLALIPLVVMIVVAFLGYHNAFANFAGIIVAALLLGQGLGDVAGAFKTAMGTTTAVIGMVIMLGAGLGNLMTEAGITRTLVYWIVKRIGVNSQTKAKACLVVCSIIICGLLGTLGGGNAVIAPILLPIMASLGVCPTAVATLFKTAGEIGLIAGPLTGVTLITMEVTGLSYGQLMIQAVIPFAAFWLAGSWIGANRAQKRLEGKEKYDLEGVADVSNVTITPRESLSTIIFIVAFLALVIFGIITKQGTVYALAVIVVLLMVTGILSKMKINAIMDAIISGVASQAGMFLVFVTIEVLLAYVDFGGGFASLSDLLGGLAKSSGPAGVMLMSSIVGGFGIEASAAAEVQIIADMFGGMAKQVGLPMGCFAVSILAATRLTGSIYPTSNLAGQLGTAHCSNMKEALQACWIGVAFTVVFIIAYAFIGPVILG